MENKKAILVYGTPQERDNFEKFSRDAATDLKIMQELSGKNNYDHETLFLDEMEEKIGELQGKKLDNFLFYFTGHADKYHIGNKEYKTNDLMESINQIEGNKTIILDACAGNYSGGDKFEALNLPENSKVMTQKKTYSNKSLAKLLYDLDLRKQPLDNINSDSLQELKLGEIYYKQNY